MTKPSRKARNQRKVSAGRLPGDAMILTTLEVRRQLKIIAAVTGVNMKEVIARLVAAEFARVAPPVAGEAVRRLA